MKINFSDYYNSIDSFGQRMFPSSTSLQRKIGVIVAAAFAFMAALYLIKRFCFQKKSLADIFPNLPPTNYIFTDSDGKPLEGHSKGVFDLQEFEGQFTAGRLNGPVKISLWGFFSEGEFQNNQLNGVCGIAFLETGKAHLGQQCLETNGKIQFVTDRRIGEITRDNRNKGVNVFFRDSQTPVSGEAHKRELCEIWGGGRLKGSQFIYSCILAKFKGSQGLFEGQGTHKFLEDTYEGPFIKGYLNGQAKIIRKNGTTVEGQFKNGLLNGEGTITKADGRTWKGLFRNDRRLFTQPDGITLFEGQGDFNFLGTRFEGQFKDGLLNGEGTITEPDGTVYKGQFKDDLLDGSGSIAYPDGTNETGNYKKGFLIQNPTE